MFAFFDDKLFPKIFITFDHNITNESWKQFMNKWVSYDMRERPYTFIFDTQGLGMSLMKYAWKMTVFISKLKKRKKLQPAQTWLKVKMPPFLNIAVCC